MDQTSLPAGAPEPHVPAPAPVSIPAFTESRRSRAMRLTSDPATMDTIFSHICNGGTIIDLCETWDVRYSDIIKWIDASPERKKSYADSVQARNAWMDEMVVAEARLLARFDLRKLYKEDGSLKSIHELDAQTARAIASVEVDELFEGTGRDREQVGEVKKVKLWDKLKAMEMIMKHRGLVVDRHQVQQVASLEDLVSGSWNAPLPEDPRGKPPIPAETVPAPDAAVAAAPAPAAPAPLPTPNIILPEGLI